MERKRQRVMDSGSSRERKALACRLQAMRPKGEAPMLPENELYIAVLVNALRLSREQMGALVRNLVDRGAPIPEPPTPPPDRIFREGTAGTCPRCGSTEVKRFVLFGRTIGCINPDCSLHHLRAELAHRNHNNPHK